MLKELAHHINEVQEQSKNASHTAQQKQTQKTFNLKTLYPDKYANFTVNNFIISQAATSGYQFNHYRGYAGTWTVTMSHKLEKSYNTETGILTCQIRSIADSNTDADDFNTTSALHVYFIDKSAK